MAEKVPAEHDEACPGCGHPMGRHAREVGCVEGWEYDDEGVSTKDGCYCNLTLCGEHNPPSERDL